MTKCSEPDAKAWPQCTFFIIIHNNRLFHINNFKLWEKFLSTYKKNFTDASLLGVKLS